MKYLLTLFSLAFATALCAQQPTAGAPTRAQQETDLLVAKYNLDTRQAADVRRVVETRLNNLAKIAPLEQTQPELFVRKLHNVQRGALGGLRRALTTREQVDLYTKTQAQVRSDRAALEKDLMTQGKTRAEIERRKLDIYAE